MEHGYVGRKGCGIMEYSSDACDVAFVESEAGPPAASSWRHSLGLLISFPALMAVLLIAVALIGAQSRLLDPDTWWHITVGEQILRSHTWPTSDTYSFTRS